MTAITDKRNLPFFMITKPACAVLGTAFAGRRLPVARSIYFAIARLANDAGTRESVVTPRKAIATEAGVNVRVVDEYTPALEACGLLRVERVMTGGVNLPNRWTLVDPPCVSTTGSDPERTTPASIARGSDPADTRGSDPACTLKEEGRDFVSTEEREEPRAAARKSVSYHGKRVEQSVVTDAERLCTVFAEATGKACAPRTRAGDATPALKQIVGALMAREDVTLATWEAAVRRTVANPPGWVDGRPLVLGDVFGERAAEHALAAATGTPPAQRNTPKTHTGDLDRFTEGALA
jgi:hypothetical protein